MDYVTVILVNVMLIALCVIIVYLLTGWFGPSGKP